MHRFVNTLVATACVMLLALAALAQEDGPSFDAGLPMNGVWIGALTDEDASPGEGGSFVHLDVEDDVAVVTAPAFGLLLTRIEVVRIAETSLTIEAPEHHIELAVSDDGKVLEGSATSTTSARHWSLRCTRSRRLNEIDERASYVGLARHISGRRETEFALVALKLPDGRWLATIDLPLSGLRDLPLSGLRVENGQLRATLPIPKASELVGSLDERRFKGELRQGPLVFELELERNDEYRYRAKARPQEPQPPFPYRSRELKAVHPRGHILAGTLTLPDDGRFGVGPYPTVVLISGGGRENRDSAALGHKPFLVIAHYLTQRGVAVFRYDDRGVGDSRVTSHTQVGKEATSLLLATDAVAVLRRLREEPDIDPARIGLMGHSEGGLIAPLATIMEPDVAFIVLLAGPGVRGADVFRKQFELEWQRSGIDEATVASLSQRLHALQEALVLGASPTRINELQNDLADALVRADGTGRHDSARQRDAMLESLREFESPWWRFVFGYDPEPVLRGVHCPVLALNGAKDQQVWHTQNLDAIEAAVSAGEGNVTAIRYPNLNHLFQPASTGAPSEYADIETTFDEGVLDDVLAWLQAKGLR
jgi:alpha-beta hydrolase superfamily lysophospholipase